jgi:hypothetical protein|tara:strand:+ start:4654 stop:5550 length:897 start_codon:yes stop_codon:yes gene_type:complete
MPIPLIIPVLSAIGRAVLTKGAQSSIKRYGREAVKKAEKEIKKRDSLIKSKAKSATHAADKSKDTIRASSREGKLRSERGQRLGKEWNKQKDEADIFREPSPEKPLRLAQGGALLVPPEMEGISDDMPIQGDIPEDAYTPEDQINAEALQLPDDEMEGDFVDYVLDEALEEEEQSYLMGALEADPRLSEIFDKVVQTASEFTGEGTVEGPGTGVSDSIPARLSDGEFVISQNATEQIGADNLQSLMDDAERAYDGGVQRMEYAFGGAVSEEERLLNNSRDEEIKKSMLSANRMPSVGR